MIDLKELYHEVILDHGKRPRNQQLPDAPTHEAKGYNPLCGDELSLALCVENGIVTDVGFRGHGCAISTASTSMMTEAIRGKSIEQVERLFAQFHELVTIEDSSVAPEELGKLAALAGVRSFPVRVKCATLAWHTLMTALDGAAEPATTE